MKTLSGILFAGCLLAVEMLAQQTSPVNDFPIPNHGALRLSTSPSWKVDAKAMTDLETLFFHVLPSKGKAFDLQMTVVWVNPANPAKATPESVRANTERTGNTLLFQAVEKTLTLRELRGKQAIGTYYTLTDRKPGPGEFKYITQGSFLAGDVLSAFTILSENPDSSDVKQLLKMLSEATYQ